MTTQLSPTTYPGVNAVLQTFTTQIQAMLGSRFVGMYLYGSLALGDINPRTSDIDILAITEGVLSHANPLGQSEMLPIGPPS